jgi:hypothetical protein
VTQLWRAATEGDTAGVTRLIAARADVGSRDPNDVGPPRLTPLAAAPPDILLPFIRIGSVCVDSSPRVLQADRTPLEKALTAGAMPARAELVRLRADVNGTDQVTPRPPNARLRARAHCERSGERVVFPAARQHAVDGRWAPGQRRHGHRARTASRGHQRREQRTDRHYAARVTLFAASHAPPHPGAPASPASRCAPPLCPSVTARPAAWLHRAHVGRSLRPHRRRSRAREAWRGHWHGQGARALQRLRLRARLRSARGRCAQCALSPGSLAALLSTNP